MDPLPWFESVKPEWRRAQWAASEFKGKGKGPQGVPEPAQPPQQPPGLPQKAQPIQPPQPAQPAQPPAQILLAAEPKPSGAAPVPKPSEGKAPPPQLRQVAQYVDAMAQFDPHGEVSDFIGKLSSDLGNDTQSNLRQTQIELAAWQTKLRKYKGMQEELQEKLRKDLADVTSELDVFTQMEFDMKISEEKIRILLEEKAKSEAEKTAQNAIDTLKSLGLSKEKVLEMLGEEAQLGSALQSYLSGAQGSQPSKAASEASEPSVASQHVEAWLKPDAEEGSESELKKSKLQ